MISECLSPKTSLALVALTAASTCCFRRARSVVAVALLASV
jgi:hypothetical protein